MFRPPTWSLDPVLLELLTNNIQNMPLNEVVEDCRELGLIRPEHFYQTGMTICPMLMQSLRWSCWELGVDQKPEWRGPRTRKVTYRFYYTEPQKYERSLCIVGMSDLECVMRGALMFRQLYCGGLLEAS